MILWYQSWCKILISLIQKRCKEYARNLDIFNILKLNLAIRKLIVLSIKWPSNTQLLRFKSKFHNHFYLEYTYIEIVLFQVPTGTIIPQQWFTEIYIIELYFSHCICKHRVNKIWVTVTPGLTFKECNVITRFH